MKETKRGGREERIGMKERVEGKGWGDEGRRKLERRKGEKEEKIGGDEERRRRGVRGEG